jgi:hypothetical protein
MMLATLDATPARSAVVTPTSTAPVRPLSGASNSDRSRERERAVSLPLPATLPHPEPS